MSDECRTKKYFQYAKNMFPIFGANLKFCSTKHLFKILSVLVCLSVILSSSTIHIVASLDLRIPVMMFSLQ